MALNVVTIDMESSTQEIEAGLELLERMIDRASTCPHRWTVPLPMGDSCVDCQVVLPDELQG